MTTRFIMVRHAETPGSLERRFTGSTDVELTTDGHRQARELAERLRPVRIDVMHVSPLTRCQQTAAPITEITGRKATIVPELREVGFGCIENMTIEEAVETFGGEKLMTWFGGEDVCPPDGETWNQVGERLTSWFAAAAERYKDRTVLAVTHGGPVLWLTRHLAEAPFRAMVVFEVDPASVTVFQERGNTWRIRSFNDTTHLAEPLMETAAPRRMP
jgi:probable phosphoglycerate mutase